MQLLLWGRQSRVRGVATLVKSPDQSPGGEAHIPLSLGMKREPGAGAVLGVVKIKIVLRGVASLVSSPDQCPGVRPSWSSLSFFRFFFYCLGCSSYCQDRVQFHSIAPYEPKDSQLPCWECQTSRYNFYSVNCDDVHFMTLLLVFIV